jgi:CBS domain-containing protein
MLCRDVMKADVYRCRERSTVRECALIMRDAAIGFVPVVDEHERAVGVVTDRDLVVRAVAENLPPDTPVERVMTRDVRHCRANDPLAVAERKMSNVQLSRLVVADDEGRCLGVISLSDLAQADSRRRAGMVLRAVTRRESRTPPVRS